MERDKKYNIILGLMIFFFVLLVGVCLAWGISAINSKNNVNDDSQEVISDNVEGATCTIIFETEDGVEFISKKVAEGKKVTKPINPTKEGYVFVEWTLAGETFDFDTKIEKDIILIAKWKETEKDQYIVTFNTDGGSKVASQIIEEGAKLSKPENPTKAGYTFVEWTLDGKTYNFNTEIEKEITLVAKWKETEKCVVTFDTKGGNSIPAQTINKNTKVSKPADPTRSGYTFTEWTLDGKAYNFNTIIKRDITLVAGWKKIENKYTVSFNTNSPVSKVPSQTITEGEKASKPSNPKNPDYTFTGWMLDGKIFDFNTPITKNITLTAGWQDIYDLTGRKCMNDTGNYSNVSTGSDWSEVAVRIVNNKVYFKVLVNYEGLNYNINLNKDYEVGIDVSMIKQILVSYWGNGLNCPVVLFLMENGTCLNLDVEEAIETANFTPKSNVPNIKNIVGIASASVSSNGPGARTIIAITEEGNFYNLIIAGLLDKG